MDMAQRMVKAIANDISDRCGRDQEWARIDAETQAEILETWAALIREELARTLSGHKP